MGRLKDASLDLDHQRQRIDSPTLNLRWEAATKLLEPDLTWFRVDIIE